MAKLESKTKANEMPIEKASVPPAQDVEEGVSSEASIREGELKRIHTFWSRTQNRTFLTRDCEH